MKNYPQGVLDMINSGHVNHAYLMTIYFSTPVHFTNAGFDIAEGGNTYISSSELEGIGELSTSSGMVVSELQINISMINSASANAIYTSEIHNTKVLITRAFLNENNDIIHTEKVWNGLVTSYADSDDELLLTLNVSNYWASFGNSNPWRTTPNSQKRRHPNDECFKFAAKASDVVFWGENPTQSDSGDR